MPEMTKHLIVDLKTGFAYGVKLDENGECKAVQPLNSAIESLDGRVINKFGPLLADRNPFGGTPENPNTLPYGQTTYAVEMTADGKTGKLFTLVWPKKEEADKGVLPVVATKPLPDNLMETGIAATPKGLKDVKGAGVDDEVTLKKALENIDNMIGLDTAKRDIKQNIAVARFNRMKQELGLAAKPISRHMVFTGNPGTGKTTFAREVAKVYHALGFIEKPVVHEVKREDLVAGFVGQTALKTKEQIDKAKGGILFIDEAYALSREAGPGSDSKDFGREAIDTLVAAMENMREDLIVIVAGYTEPMKKFIDANEGLKSRFMTYINFDDYTMPQLGQIMDFMLKERGYVMEPAARATAMDMLDVEAKRAKASFGNGRTVRNLVEKAEKELALRLENEHKLDKNSGIPPEELKKALTTITLADISGISLQGLTGAKAKPSKFGFDSDDDKKAAARAFNDNTIKPEAPAVEVEPKAPKPASKGRFAP
ncbi:MAG: AAA family ATPase [Alphaproteobacteria bacterium]|nr:MAG: AAA family ATPase [Alphaproteobacteria bacterium]